jgi:hypothetical protein
MTDSKRIIDLVIHSTAVELLASFGVAAAPTPTFPNAAARALHELVGSIPFNAPGFRGTLLLSVSNATLASMRAGSEPHVLREFIRELTNQLMGRIKNRFLRYQLSLTLGLPSALSSHAVTSRRPSVKEYAYTFRTLTGDVVVLFCADFEDAKLSFSSATVAMEEGDVVLF